MLPVLRKRELVFTRQVADGIAIAGGIQQKNIGEVGKHRANRRCSGWRSNKVMLSSSRVRPPQRASTAEKQVASAIVGVTPYSPARLLKACQRVAGTIMRRRVLRTSRSVAGSQASGKTGAGEASMLSPASKRARRLSVVD